MSSRWWHRPFLSSDALQDHLGTLYCEREPKAPCAPPRLTRTMMEDYEEQLPSDDITLPQQRPHQMEAQSLCFFQWGGEARWISSSTSIVRHFPGDSFGCHFTGILRGQIKIWKVGRAFSNQCSDLGRLHSSSQVHLSRDHSQHLCHLQNQAAVIIWTGGSMGNSAWYRCPARELCWLWILFYGPPYSGKHIWRLTYC